MMNRRFLVPLVPALLSVALSLTTVGSHVFWQDSGFYLTAVHEMSVLYPHGFVVYQLLCTLWTLALFFVDFTLAVHLFSAACSAGAAAILALAARDFVRDDLAGLLTGVLVASGYTFWMSGLYAKGYSLLYLVLALLLWTLVRAGSAPKPRDVLVVALLAGLAWAVHPSAALGAIALGWFFLRAAASLGWKVVLPRVAAGALPALLPALVLPLLAARDRETSLGHPTGAGEIFRYLLGSRYTGAPGVFGFDSGRLLHLAAYFWEEHLAIGLIVIGLGLFALARSKRSLLLAGAAWTVPFAGIALLFKIEGQSDHWYVAAGLPLTLATATGLQSLAARGRAVAGAVAGAAVIWAAVANGPDLSQRSYVLAETYADLHFQNLEPRSIFVVQTDDILATCWYQQFVKKQRPAVLIVPASHLGFPWYEESLKRRHPEIRPSGDAAGDSRDDRIAAFLSANARGDRPLYTLHAIAGDRLPAGWVLSPRGVVMKLVPSAEDRLDPAWWQFPMEAEQVPALYRRSRGLSATYVNGVFTVDHEPYERRLLKALTKARIFLADWHFRRGGTEAAVRLYESILPLDPDSHRNERMIHSLGLSYLALGKDDKAEIALRSCADIALNPWTKASSLLGLGDVSRKRGRADQARAYYQDAARIPGLTPEQRREVDRRLSP
jgi:hypothetical protein